MALHELIRVLPPPTHPHDTGSLAEWAAVESRLGIVFPSDYKDYIRAYGSGAVDTFVILNPMGRAWETAPDLTDALRSIDVMYHTFHHDNSRWERWLYDVTASINCISVSRRMR